MTLLYPQFIRFMPKILWHKDYHDSQAYIDAVKELFDCKILSIELTSMLKDEDFPGLYPFLYYFKGIKPNKQQIKKMLKESQYL